MEKEAKIKKIIKNQTKNMENENKGSNSNGMELLEKLIQSNKENIEQNVELKFAIEDHTTLLYNLQMSLEGGQSLCDETASLFKLERTKRAEFIASIPTQLETVLTKETRNYLDDFQNNIKRGKKFIWGGIGFFVIAVIILITSINFASNWYKESIKAKSELRQDILKEIADEGKKIYDEKEVMILSENTQIMQLWMKSNPKKAEDFLRFKDGFKASKENR